jgi:acetyl-CoA carboxylase carboxyltransferase component
MASKSTKGEILAKFFDDGEYTALFADGAVSAASGYAAGQQAYAVFQNGEAVSVKDVEKNIKVLELAAQTGCPVVTFYDSVGAKLAEGLDVLNAAAKLNATIAKVSGVVPQVAVVLGVCGGTSALNAANADVCIMAEGAELFFTAPFTAAAKGDKVADAGSAAADAAEAAEKAAHIVGLLPANNLTGPAIFEFEQPTAVLSANAEPAKAAAALIDKDSAVEMYAGFGKNVYTAFATIGGNAVGVVATGKELCHNCVAKASRFVRLCDAFSVPVLTIVNTEGFVPSTSDDIAGGIREAARLAATYADATTAKVALIAGKAVGPVYTALAAADLKIAVKGCTISALEPSAAVSVLYKDEIDASDNIVAATKAKAAAYVAEVCSADAAVAAGSADMTCEAANARASVVAAFELLSTKRAARLPKKHGNMAL